MEKNLKEIADEIELTKKEYFEKMLVLRQKRLDFFKKLAALADRARADKLLKKIKNGK